LLLLLALIIFIGVCVELLVATTVELDGFRQFFYVSVIRGA